MTLFAEIVLPWKATDLRFLNKKQPLDEPLFDDRNDGGVTLDADLRGGVDLGIEGKTCYVDLLLREASLEAISLLCAT